MKNTLPDNIPETKKEELSEVIKIIKKKIKPEFIILFGSYAKGNFVEYDETYVEHHTESYESDFDILVVVSNEAKENAWKMWAEIEGQLGRKVSTNVDLLVHNIHFGYNPLEIFPRNSEPEKHLFNLLLRSYVDARYRKSFKISEKELEVLFERVKKIESRIEKLCEEKIVAML